MTKPDARPLLGWVVDVQRDFMEPDGRLYVHDLKDPSDPGAKLARSAIVDTVSWMKDHCQTTVFTGDWHGYGDREIDTQHPDAMAGTYPPHCMGMSDDADERTGAALITEIDPGANALVLNREATPSDANEIAQSALQSGRPVFLQKKEFSCFEGNPATDPMLEAMAKELAVSPHVVVCGVATDVCVRHAVEGMLDRGLSLTIVRDATWSLGLLSSAETWERWAERGAEIVSVANLLQRA
jgi:nicotinamidase-related amidase